MSSDIGLIGLAVMGENLVLNIESRGFSVSLYNRSTDKVDTFINGRGAGKNFLGFHNIAEFCKSLSKPRKVMIMVKSGNPVDAIIAQIMPYLEDGDIIIDGGNSFYKDSIRRCEDLEKKGFLYVGTGVSGGEEGALIGPSIMPGGSKEAWQHIKPIFTEIAAKTSSNETCCEWIGSNGSGHFVKMVHNGIEYGDMQMISEIYHIMKQGLNLSNQEMYEIFKTWNDSELDSYLIEITSKILGYKDDDGEYVIDLILDATGQKGTGKWTTIAALDYGQPLTLIGEAVFARCLSSFKDERLKASSILSGPKKEFIGEKKEFIKDLKNALYASKIVSYAQGFQLLRAASDEYNWKLDKGNIALLWRGGCIIRSVFLNKIKSAYDSDSELENLLLDSFFSDVLKKTQESWRKVVCTAVDLGIPIPAISSALSYYDGYRCEKLPANLLQAQRDFFGAHTYERIDRNRGEFFHSNWTGYGGETSSSNYEV